ncbi:hypothetical protein BAMA_16250 [Bacillus manliponensis]|uniref:HTH cro/C1-type domain-containing protein n=1 Tax=Bacillus manliponensis TaxID=574376 RepID=A0A073JQ82_9BACI|nr:helix-turn-helix transcriptional regulator [Bacillus manliponensis]KEK17244.1 hypothetical protein BAMA_16250 [Bacillus manliponensis]
MGITERIKTLCQNRGISVSRLEEELEFGQNTIYQWKKRTPSVERVQKVADYFDVSIDFLLGRTEQEYTNTITNIEEDTKDIGKRMEEIRNDLMNTDGLMFSGEPLSEEALDSLMDAMEYIVRHTHKVNKRSIQKKSISEID